MKHKRKTAKIAASKPKRDGRARRSKVTKRGKKHSVNRGGPRRDLLFGVPRGQASRHEAVPTKTVRKLIQQETTTHDLQELLAARALNRALQVKRRQASKRAARRAS